MEIRGPLYSPLPQATYDPAQRPTSQANDHSRSPDQQSGHTARPVRTISATGQFESDPAASRSKHRFANRDMELPRPTQQAINSYESADLAGGPELLNRVDVFA